MATPNDLDAPVDTTTGFIIEVFEGACPLRSSQLQGESEYECRLYFVC